MTAPVRQVPDSDISTAGGDDAAPAVAALRGHASLALIADTLDGFRSRPNMQVLMAVVEALTRRGLAGLAVRVLEAVPGLVQANQDIASLVDQLSALPSGQLAWERLAAVGSANLDAISVRQPDVCNELDGAHPGENELCLYQASCGGRLVVTTGGATFPDLTVFSEGPEETEDDTGLPPAGKCGSFLLRGVPNSKVWRQIIRRVHDNGYQPPIDLIESDCRMLSAWLCLTDVRAVVGSGRLRIYVGGEAGAHYEEAVASSLGRRAGEILITNARFRWQPPEVGQDLLDRARNVRTERQRELIRQQRRLYDGEVSDSWAERFERAAGGRGGLRIVAFTTRFSTVIRHAMRDLASAFRRRGCDVDLVMEPDLAAAEVDTWTALASRPYDLVVVINHLKSEMAGRIDARLPYVCWCQDHMDGIWRRDAARSLGENEIVLTHHPWQLAEHFGYDEGRMIETANLTDAEVFSAEPVPTNELQRFAADVAYVSHGAGTPEQLARAIGADDEGLVDCLMRFVCIGRRHLEERGTIAGFDLYRLMLEAERASGFGPLSPSQRGSTLIHHALRLYDRMLRHETLRWAAEWARGRGRSFRIYGRGWEAHRDLSEYAAGEVSNGFDLRCVYQATAVNLQVNAYGSLHQRLLDCLAAGGFIISRCNPTDLLRDPWMRLREILVARGIGSFAELDRAAQSDATLRLTVKELTHLGVPCLDPSRRVAGETPELVAVTGALPEDPGGEHGFFRTIVDPGSVPGRVAGDIPGFTNLTFGCREAMHGMLDRFVDGAGSRQAAAAPMRDAVVAYDTYDGLVERILNRFGRILAKCTADGEGPATPVAVIGARNGRTEHE